MREWLEGFVWLEHGPFRVVKLNKWLVFPKQGG